MKRNQKRPAARWWLKIFPVILVFTALATRPALADVRDNVYGYSGTNIYTLDLQTGGATVVYTFSSPLSFAAALAQRPSDGVLFYIDGSSGNDTVYSWDPNNPANAPVRLGRTGSGVPYLPRFAFAANGTLYAIDQRTTNFFTINQTNGAATRGAALTGGPNAGGDIVFAGDGTCYMVAAQNLYTVPLGGGAVTNLGTITGLPSGTSGNLPGLAFDKFGRMLVCNQAVPSQGYVVNPSTLVATAFSSNLGAGISCGDLATVPRRLITGFVYNDTNHNATLDAGESGTGLALYVKLIATNAPGTAVLVTNANPATGSYTFNAVLGAYNIIVSSNASPTNVTPYCPPGWAGTQSPNQIISNVVVGASNLANDNFGFFDGSVVILSMTANPTTSPTNVNATFTLTFSNFSGTLSQTLTNIVDTLPAGVGYVAGSSVFNGGAIGNPSVSSGVAAWTGPFLIPPGTARTLTFVASVPGVAGIYTNQAVAHTSSLLVDTTTNSADNVPAVATVTITGGADVGITKTGPSNVQAGTNFTYTITVTNAGPSTATNVIVSDTLPTNVVFVSASGNGATNSGVASWNLGNLAAGAKSNLTLTVTAPFSGNITNVATVASSTTDPNLVNNTSPPVGTAVTPVANLVIGKTGPASVGVLSNFTYAISVTNLGPSPAVGVVVTDALPAGVTFVGASGNGANNSGVVNWSLGALNSGQVSNLTLTVKATVSGSITNTASVNSGTLDTNTLNNTSPPAITTVTPVADVAVAKTGPAGVFAGTNFIYTITVTNAGPSTASNVVASDVLPTNVVFVSASGNGATNSGVASWTIGTLAANATTNLTVTVTAPAGGNITNSATVVSTTADPNLTNNTSPPVGTSVTPAADVAVTASGPANVFAGTNFIYTVTVTNSGPSTASNVVVSDVLPANIVFISATGGGTSNSGAVTWPVITALTNGGTFTFTVTVTAPANGTLTNIVSGVSPTGDPNPANNNGSSPSAIVVTTVTPLADLAVGKSGAAGSFLGANFGYTISVTNFGPSAAANLSVTDNLPAGIAFSSVLPNNVKITGSQIVWTNLGSLAAGAVTNLALNVTTTSRGAVTNFASAGSPTVDPNSTNNLSAPVVTAVTNRPPVAVNDSGSTPENVSVTVPVLANDGDPDGDALTIISVSPTNGTASIVGTNVVFLPATNFVGTAYVAYTITDNFGGTNSALVTILVTNRPPVANPDNYAVTENTTNTFPVLTNDLVVTPGGTLTIISVSPTNGIATILNGTNIVFTPTNNFLGTTTIGYTIIDNVGGTNSSIVTVLVTNIPPVANPDFYIVPENSTNTFSPLTNDVVQTPGGTLSIIGVSPTNGTATIVGGTNVTFTPTNNFLGTATIGYTIIDNVGGTNSSIVTVLVTNIPPVANPDFYIVPENSTNTFSPLTNDVVQTPGGTLSIIGVSPTNGTATIVGGTNVTFTPTNNFLGTATIGYTITDGIGGTNSSLITVTVTNIPPVAFSQSVSTTENTALPITLTGSDPANLPLTFMIVTQPGGGTLTGLNTNTGAVTYTPTNNFLGTDTFAFRVNNGYNNSSNANVTITVTPVADLLVQQSGPAAGVAGSNLVFTVAVTNLGPADATNVVVTNQVDPGFTFFGASSSGALNGNLVTWTIPVLPANGATNFTVTLFAMNGGTFTNVASGGDATPDLIPADNDGSMTNAQVVTAVSALADVAVFKTGDMNALAGGTVNYTITATNAGPSTASNVVVQDELPSGAALQTVSGGGISNNGVVTWPSLTLTNGASTNFTVVLTAPVGGILTNIALAISSTSDPNSTNNNGSSSNSIVSTTVTPVADLAVGKSGAAGSFLGANFGYTISVTNFGPSAAANLSVTDNLPAGIAFSSALPNNVKITGSQIVWTNLGSLASGAVTNLALNVTTTSRGAVTNFASAGSPTLDPNSTNNLSAPVVTAVTNRPPVAVNDSGSTARNVLVTIPVLANDSDPDGDSLTIISISPTNGIATILNGTNIVFTPTNAAPGTDVFGYTITDNFGGTNSALVTVTVTNRPPVAVNDFASTARNVAVTIPVLANDSDPDGDSLTIISVSPTNGAAIISGTNIVFTPTNAAPGTDVFGYTITDNFGGTNSALVTVIVTNRPPVAVNDNASTARKVAVTIPVLANDSDPDGDVLTIISVSPTNGTAIISGTNIVFTPTNAAPGTDVFGYTITDNFDGTNSALVTVIVTNRPPVAANDNASTPKNVQVTIPVLANDSDPDGDALTIVSVSPTNGTANIVGTNVVFTPTNNFTGTATVSYTITDDFGGTNSALIFILVTNRPPVANNQNVTTTENVPVPITLTGGDPDGDPLAFAVVAGPANGVLGSLNTNTGAVTYTPSTNFVGADSFTFLVNDGTANSTVATVSVTVASPVPADIAVFKTGPAGGVAGSNLTYTITVTNIGPSAATNVLVGDQLPAGFTFVSATPAASVVLNNLVSWPAFNLANKGRTNFTVTAVSADGGNFTNIAFATSDTYDPNPTNNNGTATNSQTVTVVMPRADVAVFKAGGTNIVAGGTVTYTITATNSGPSTASNVVVQDDLPANVTFQSASAGYTLSNNVVTWPALTLTNGDSTNFTVSLIVPASGNFTNIALATSTTPDPNLTNNNGSAIASKVRTSITPVADIIVLLSGPPNVNVGNNFTYTIVVTNGGPSTASNVVVSDTLPTNLVFVSASSGGAFLNHVITWPQILSLPVGGSTNFTLTVNAPDAGQFTNVASALASTLDLNLTNNNGTLPASQVQTVVAPSGFALLAGAPVFNPQTGLFEETVTVTNIGPTTVAGFQLYVTVLTPNVYLYDATGTNGGVPYVEYDFPVDPTNTASMILKFYDPSRGPFTNTLSVVAIIPPNSGTTGTNGSVAISKIFTDTRIPGDTRYVIEFSTVPGKVYTIIYSDDDMATWKVATPSVTAAANVTQWYDDGPPETDAKPASRFYRVIQN